MLIAEIQRQRGDAETLDFSQQGIDTAEKKRIKMVPGNKRYGYTFGIHRSEYTGSSQAVFLYDLKNAKNPITVGYLALRPTSFVFPKSYAVANVAVGSQYRGQGLGQILYIIATKLLGLTIVADETQTPQARRLWVHLHQVPGMEVSGYASVFASDWAEYPDVYDLDADKLIKILKRINAQIIGRKRGQIILGFPVIGGPNGKELQSVNRGLQLYSAKHPDEGGTDNGLYARWTGNNVIREDDEDLPPIVYHGTDTKNLTNILRQGLKPRRNRWLSGPSRQFQRDVSDIKPVLSTIPSLDVAIQFANQGGSTGWETGGGVVLGFRPLPTDKVHIGGYLDGEIEFHNTIAPERLFIAWPDDMKGKLADKLAAAQELNVRKADKSQLVKDTNKQLKSMGSIYRVKNIGTPNKMRVRVFRQHETVPNYLEPMNYHGIPDMDITSPEFQTWLDSAKPT